MANKKIRVGNLSATVQEILREYGDDVVNGLEEVNITVGDYAVKRLRAESRQHGWKQYASGWEKTDDSTRFTKKMVIHHKTPGLPHLLEHGHLTMLHGKRVKDAKAIPHIKPVEDELIELYPKKVKEEL